MGKNIFWLLLLPLLLLLFFHDVLLSGKTLSTSSLLPGTTPNGPYGFSGYRPEMPFSFDISGNAYVNEPNPYIVREILDEHALPGWNPLEGLGIPLAGNLNTEVFNPLKIFLNLFPTPFSQDMFFLLRLLVMGFFVFLFLRELHLSHASSLFGSSFFMLSGYSVWWVNLHPLSTVMYLPAVFYFYERWSKGKDIRNAFFMSLFLSFALIAGKIPDVIMGLALLFPYALWKGFLRDSIRGLAREGTKVIIGVISGAFLASVALFPFIELYSRASPLAKAVRTGAASHTIPLITSVSLFQPLFLGWGNYFYGSWLHWEPSVVMPHAAIVIVVLSFYALLNLRTFRSTFPFFIFSLLLFSIVYGILPAHLISKLPVFGSIEFLKYNAMLYFSLAVMSASAFDSLTSEKAERKKLYLSVCLTCSFLIIYFFTLYSRSPSGMRSYITIVLFATFAEMVLVAIVFRLSKKKHIFGSLVFIFLIAELYLYMPKDHPDRFNPYREPPYKPVITETGPYYRITGGGNCLPPLVSNAIGLPDVRAVSVLLPGDYYIFFENLLGFSVPQTNNPDPLFTATSPFIDLVGVRYILSHHPLEQRKLDEVINSHIASLRWVRLFDAMVKHSIQGGAYYGVFRSGGEERLSFFFPMRFLFETKLRVSEPYMFAGFAIRGVPGNTGAKIRIAVEGRAKELIVNSDGWKDQWMDISEYMGKVVTVTVESDGRGEGNIVLGNFGLSPGYEKERTLYQALLALHKRELDSLEYKGLYGGMHIYENRNVMERAFVLHKVRRVQDLGEVIKELQGGIDFRKAALVTDSLPRISGDMLARPNEKVFMKKYASDQVIIDVESGGGLLVLSDLYFPGWRVKVNGKEARIIRAFGLLRGVVVEDGKSEVVFYYRPMSLFIGIILSCMTCIVWIIILLIAHRRSRLQHG